MTNETRELADAIAAHLDGWRAESPHDHGAQLVRESDGVRLWLRTNDYQHRGRLVISGGVPDGASYSDGDTHGVDRPEITVALTRAPEVIAREITRRLIPGAVETWEEVAGRIARRLARADARKVLAGELADIMGTTAREWRDTWQADLPDRLRHGSRYLYGELVPSHDATTVACEIRNMSPEQARELATLVAGWQS